MELKIREILNRMEMPMRLIDLEVTKKGDINFLFSADPSTAFLRGRTLWSEEAAHVVCSILLCKKE
jgi:hypothetical protein